MFLKQEWPKIYDEERRRKTLVVKEKYLNKFHYLKIIKENVQVFTG